MSEKHLNKTQILELGTFFAKNTDDTDLILEHGAAKRPDAGKHEIQLV